MSQDTKSAPDARKPVKLDSEALDAVTGGASTTDTAIFSGKGGWAGIKGGNNETSDAGIERESDKPLSGTDLGSGRVK